MKKLILPFVLAASLPAHAMELDTLEKKSSYFFGVQTAQQLEETGLKINEKAFSLGLKDGINQAEMKLSDEEIQAMIMQLRQLQMQTQQQQASNNLKAGEDFLAENSKKSGVTTTASGLQYKILTAGKGDSPKASDIVVAHYEGRLINGEIFDSSFQRGQPIEFPVQGVIKGWQEALQLMNIGAKWEVYIPSNLAYGERGSAPKIGPNETLIFTIELMSFKSE